jgi:predicted DNA-binding transcriptional regulator AlpA
MNANHTETVTKTFLAIPDAASLAGFSRRHFRRIIKDTLIRRVKIGRRVFILAADFNRWQAERKVRVLGAD